MEVEFTQHAEDILDERRLEREWVLRAIERPERSEEPEEGTRHFLLRIPERQGRVLRVVVNTTVEPWRVVTAFFDRKMKGMVP